METCINNVQGRGVQNDSGNILKKWGIAIKGQKFMNAPKSIIYLRFLFLKSIFR